jgi:RNA polymerase sigma-70 factor, ECF subfamily
VEPASDDYLVRRAQAGYLDAFEELVVRHRDRAYRVALRLLGSPPEAEDVTQDSLVQAWQALGGFRGDSSFSSWLYRIVVNRSRDAQRRSRTVPLPVDPLDRDVEARLRPVEDSAQVVEAGERVAALRAAVAALPFDLRAPLVLCEFERCSYLEAAEVLGLSEPQVRGRLARARRALVHTMRGWS